MERSTRREFLLAVGTTALAGCSEVSDRIAGSGGDSTDAPGTSRTPAGSAPPVADHRLPLPMKPSELREEALSGGPPKDGIPSIDDPSFIVPGEVDFLDDGDPVFGVVREGVAKAYPQKILVRHEICNDVFDGRPVSVTYCPLTGTAMGFERGSTTFGVSGRLINSNLVMYDRATEAWWPQVLATSIPGPWNANPGTNSLREFRVVWTTWKRWRTQHPDTSVLSRDTGYAMNYTFDPYGSYNPRDGYYKRDSLMFPVLHPDDRYSTKRIFIGVRTPDGAAAFLKDALRKRGVMDGTIGGTPIVAIYDESLDTAWVYRNPGGKSVSLSGNRAELDGSTFRPEDLPLDSLIAFDAMWFAWAGFYPNTNVYA